MPLGLPVISSRLDVSETPLRVQPGVVDAGVGPISPPVRDGDRTGTKLDTAPLVVRESCPDTGLDFGFGAHPSWFQHLFGNIRRSARYGMNCRAIPAAPRARRIHRLPATDKHTARAGGMSDAAPEPLAHRTSRPDKVNNSGREKCPCR
jgi:hypothetical protein